MKICFIVHSNNKGTILDRIAHEIGRGFDEAIYHYEAVNLPKADHYFVTHYSMLNLVMMGVNPATTPVTCFFTHDKGSLYDFKESFNLCHSVVAESPEGMAILAKIGVKPEILHFVPEGGDNIAFKPHARTEDGAILVCGTNYSDGRKNPDLIKAIVEMKLGREFVFLGKDWGELTSKVEYADYPKVYDKCSVYLSCSKLEGGGPNSLIEAMHANLVPVVSDTGNARQYIVDGYNGFIFPHDSTPEHVASLIEAAYKLTPQKSIPYADVWQTVRNFGWKEYALNMKEIITNDYSVTISQNLDENSYEVSE